MTYLIAHVGGVPVEELLVPLASGASALGVGMLLALFGSRRRMLRRPVVLPRRPGRRRHLRG